jgi:hypothetical protein
MLGTIFRGARVFYAQMVSTLWGMSAAAARAPTRLHRVSMYPVERQVPIVNLFAVLDLTFLGARVLSAPLVGIRRL